ncbi:hypothetical protein PHLCEN_2v10526 [Hermanssonia centrifuga]|uniref:Uncharacterized protein n=1 Tax=Hermanssonia centrifuga TaxID=98765 RepID=A0A2R6NMJ7_9APHY|nr:hypothetical protein PHLCEN_2v10526 [Hermanssonia centrifuga]
MDMVDSTLSVRHGSFTDEKVEDSSVKISSVDIDLNDKDEALKLVGLERTGTISEERSLQVRRKLDLVIPPLCAAVYCTQFLDKNVLNYASIMGLPITGQHYNLAALAFYLGFMIWVFPTMYISQKLRLGKYLGANIVLWGIVMMLHAVPNSFGPFFVLRILLGMLESCVAPVLILIISMFYKKNEQARRISWFYLMNGVSGIFGGFVAYGISFDTSTRFAPYKIMYLLCGALAIMVGIAVLIWMPDSPLHAKFLTKEERIAAIERVRDDQGGTENKRLKIDQLKEAVTDIRTWLIVLSTLIRNYIIGTFGSSLAIIYAWNASNTSGHTKKVTINAMTLAAFCLGNIIGTETFLPKDAPNYVPGKVAILVLLSTQFFLCFLLRWINLHLNKKKRMLIASLKESNNWSDLDVEKEKERHAFLDMTDKQNPYFVYTELPYEAITDFAEALTRSIPSNLGYLEFYKLYILFVIQTKHWQGIYTYMHPGSPPARPPLTADTLLRAASLSTVDKTQLIKSYIRSQKEYHPHHVAEGKKVYESWNACPTQTVSPAQEATIRDAGFSTPVLKPRVALAPSANPESSFRTAASHRSQISAEKQVGNPTRRQKRILPAMGSAGQPHSEDKKFAIANYHKPPPLMQDNLNRYISSTKQPKAAKSNAPKKRARSPDADREAILSERRERRRSKKAIVEHARALSISDDSELDGRVAAGEKSNGRQSKGKGKNINLSAGLALMHGFSAENVGPNRLTLKPSFGVFQKGKASLKAKTKPKAPDKHKSGNAWSEMGFLNSKQGVSGENQSSRGSESEIRKQSSSRCSVPVSPPPKKKQRRSKSPLKKDTESKVKPVVQDDKSESNVCATEQLASIVSAPMRGTPRAESIVWDMERHEYVPPPPSFACERKNGTILVDTRTTKWNIGQSAQLVEGISPLELACSSVNGHPGIQDNINQAQHDSPASVGSSVSLNPSQSASQIAQNSQALETDPQLHRSKYFLVPLEQLHTTNSAALQDPASEMGPKHLSPIDGQSNLIFGSQSSASHLNQIQQLEPPIAEGPAALYLEKDGLKEEGNPEAIHPRCLGGSQPSIVSGNPVYSEMGFLPDTFYVATSSIDHEPYMPILNQTRSSTPAADTITYDRGRQQDDSSECNDEPYVYSDGHDVAYSIRNQEMAYPCGILSNSAHFIGGSANTYGHDNVDPLFGRYSDEDLLCSQGPIYAEQFSTQNTEPKMDVDAQDFGDEIRASRQDIGDSSVPEDCNSSAGGPTWEFDQPIAGYTLDVDVDSISSTAGAGDLSAHGDLEGGYCKWREGCNTESLDLFCTVSKVEEDVAKQLRGHWLPQRL